MGQKMESPRFEASFDGKKRKKYYLNWKWPFIHYYWEIYECRLIDVSMVSGYGGEPIKEVTCLKSHSRDQMGVERVLK
jgi:hypothetical protein